MEFLSNDNVVRERTVHPYKLYLYHNAWFMRAYCESQKMILPFKLNRITSFSVLQQRFDYVREQRKSETDDPLDASGMKKVPDWSGELGGKDAPMQIKLRLSGKPAMYVKEYLYGENQTVLPIDKDTTIL